MTLISAELGHQITAFWRSRVGKFRFLEGADDRSRHLVGAGWRRAFWTARMGDLGFCKARAGYSWLLGRRVLVGLAFLKAGDAMRCFLRLVRGV